MHVVLGLSANHTLCIVTLGCTGVLGLPVMSVVSQGTGGGVGWGCDKSFYRGGVRGKVS